MARSPIRLHWLATGILLQSTLLACGADDGQGGIADVSVGASGGAVAQGGSSSNATGGVVTTNRGGQQNVGQGGAAAGGMPAAGGNATGGKANTGGAANLGGNATGGKATGGSTATGGQVNLGGSATGGKATGGSATGGKATGGSSTGGAATGGKATGGSATGGAATGGKATGGSATGGAATGGAATGGVTSTGAGPTVTCGCTTSSGEFSGNNIKSTIVVDSGETYDGQCKTFRADPSSLGPGDQSEGQDPVFEVNGGTLKNVILGASAADGIHISGNATLNNIHWLDIGEDAMTVKGSGTMTLDCGSSKLGEDKTFQVNAASTITIRNFTARSAGKFMRQNGGTTFKMSVIIDHCDIAGMDECIYRTDSSTSTVTMTNTRYSNIGDSLFIFGSTNYGNANVSGKVTVSGNVAY